MSSVTITRESFLENRLGRTFADVLDDPEQPFDEVLGFFSDADRQRRMDDAETHHDRPALAGVVRELEALPAVDQFLKEIHARRSNRLRQAIGVVVRMIMERRGWRKTGRKGSLGVRAPKREIPSAFHNTGGLAFWFIRGERYEREEGMPFRSVRERCEELDASPPQDSPAKQQRNAHTGRRKAGSSDRSVNKKR
jgi:hypothetical protein